jgi:hypothetical protein
MDDKGDILVPEDALYNNLFEVSVLPPRGETYTPPQDIYKKEPVGIQVMPANGGYNSFPPMQALPPMPTPVNNKATDK